MGWSEALREMPEGKSSPYRWRAGRLDPAAHFGQCDSRPALAGGSAAAEDHFVAVLEEGPLGAALQLQRLLSQPGQLEQAALGAGLRARDRARGVEVAGVDLGSVDRRVGELLGGAPVEEAGVACG